MNAANGPGAARGQDGFTLLELTIAMGLLAAFLLLLVQLLSSGVHVFDAGERSQQLADRSLTATRAVQQAVESMVGPRSRAEVGEADPDARLLVYWVGAPAAAAEQPPTRIQVVRATARLSPGEEDLLLEDGVRAGLAAVGIDDEEEVRKRARELRAELPRRGRGELLLLPWPVGDGGEYFELRLGRRLAEPQLLAEGELLLSELVEPGDLTLDAGQVLRTTRPVATGLLHFDVALWSPQSRQWTSAGGPGAEQAWDSARAGMLLDREVASEDFGLDLGPDSLRDPRDDVWPRWLRVTIVVGRPQAAAAEAILVRALAAADRTAQLNTSEELEGGSSRHAKIGGEWVRFADAGGGVLDGIERGVRGTAARDHPAGTPVRYGREVILHLPMLYGRDSDG